MALLGKTALAPSRVIAAYREAYRKCLMENEDRLPRAASIQELVISVAAAVELAQKATARAELIFG